METTETEMQSYVAVFSTIPKLAKCLQAVLPNVRFQEVSPGAGDELKLLREAQIVVGDNNLVGLQLYNLTAAKWVQGTWAGVETMLTHYDSNKPKPSFIFTRFSDYHFGCAMGEYVIANIVNHERNMLQVYENQRKSLWTKEGNISDHRIISDLVIGILGVGTIGLDIAKLLKTLKAQVWGMVRNMPEEDRKSPYIDVYSLTSELPNLLQNCDYIINVLPNTKETIGLLNGDILKNCATKKSVLINIGRGSVINEDDLINALNNGWISAAILDVFENEPLPASSPLWKMAQVKITPHVSGCSRPQHIAEFFKENFLRFQAGQPLKNVLDFEKGY